MYLDDVFIASPDAVLDCLHLHCLSINPAMCEFAKPEIAYLGMRVSKGCIPLQKHSVVISAFPHHVDKKGLLLCLCIDPQFQWSCRNSCSVDGSTERKGFNSLLDTGYEPFFLSAKSGLSQLSCSKPCVPRSFCQDFISVDASGSHIGVFLEEYLEISILVLFNL